MGEKNVGSKKATAEPRAGQKMRPFSAPNKRPKRVKVHSKYRACEKGGQLPRRETRPRPLRLKRRTHIQQLLGTGIAHRARPLGGGDLHSEKHMWRFTNPTNHMWRSDREHRHHWRSAKGSQKVELMFGNTIQAVQYIQRPRVHEQESLRMSAGRRAR